MTPLPVLIYRGLLPINLQLTRESKTAIPLRDSITITQSLRNISQLPMVPTNQNILSRPLAVVIFHEICNAIGIVTITRCVYGETQIVGEWLNSLKWPFTLATCMNSIFVPILRPGKERLDFDCSAIIYPILYSDEAPKIFRGH